MNRPKMLIPNLQPALGRNSELPGDYFCRGIS